MIVVLDASATGAVLLPDERDPLADFTLEQIVAHDIHVPSVWHSELVNLIVKAVRRQRIDFELAEHIISSAQEMTQSCTVAPDVPMSRLFDLAIRYRLSAYDASYAELARRLDAPLLTRDGPLARAASEIGLRLLKP